ncbi:carboxylesterase/lipase family protein [Cytophagaceae bacterium DM2B3-1]|uniref:Carboxylic ester hydrolase n=1 Tax=Xanthocytophaga flava TaxID=3048013 RepID=A0ABT7CTH4_9BACT|nr:carboxylesterase/lipase family protein [Xanthocytophaga flavus]MDJ1467917.1 carboxylesterase/lipase family protein [Xanthocytophaga flavus]MDJ1497044.1 carboxylesterase/lipase family protein [Xanthocytophaga flavus]
MKRPFTLLLCIFLQSMYMYSVAQKPAPSPDPITSGAKIAVAQTEYGKVRGYIHNGIFTYKGIPYAQAARFMPPVKPASWEGVRSSMTYGPVCPLIDPTTAVNDESEFLFHHDWGYTNEDCLRLNIWSQGINDTKKRPVMVWLHGGGYSAGSSQELPSYDGENLSKKGDVVVVSVNHRLNILGFLDLSAYGEKYKSSANVGMMDLVAALQWVKGNIARFGGDPDNVTIFGQSGGGGKVSTLMNAPSAKGLFHKAIIQSGGGGLNFKEKSISGRISAAVLEELGLKSTQIDSIQKVPYDKLAAAGKKALRKVQEQLKAEGKEIPGFGLGWGPTQDGTFLPYQPTAPEAIALSSDIPLMVGSTKNEFMASLRDPSLRTASQDEIKDRLQKQYGEKTDAYLSAVKKAYPADTHPTDLIDIDDMFRRGAIKQADLKSTGKAPVFMYLFTWQSPVQDGEYKAVHCMEIAFAFNNISRCEEMTGGGKEAIALAQKVSQAWINFAKTGNPNHKGLPVWQKYTPANGATMIFDNQCVEKYHHDKEFLEITPSRML